MARNKADQESLLFGFLGVVFGLFLLDALFDDQKKPIKPVIDEDPNAGFRQDAENRRRDRERLKQDFERAWGKVQHEKA